MLKLWKKWVTALLALMLAVEVVGCGGMDGGEDREKLLFHSAPVYRKEDIPLPLDAGYLAASCTDGDAIYFAVDTAGDGEMPQYALFQCSSSGDISPLEDYQPSQAASGDSAYVISGLSGAPDGTLWSLDWWTVPGGGSLERSDERSGDSREIVYLLRQLDEETGGVLQEVDISEAVRSLGGVPITGWAVDGEGTIYLSTTSCVAVLDSEGQTLFTLDANIPTSPMDGSDGGTVALLSDGGVAALTALSDGTRQVRTIHPESQGWGQGVYPLPAGASRLYSGSGGYLFYYLASGDISGWIDGENGEQELLSWPSVGVTGSVACFLPVQDGSILALVQKSAGTGGRVRLYRLLPSDTLEDGRAVLVYGTIHAQSDLLYRVNTFNENNEQYFIEVRDYAEGLGYGRDARQQARKRLLTEIAAGQIPDIMGGEWMPISQLAAKGLLEDLWPYIENDPDLGREGMMEHVLDCAATDGKLYEIGSGFGIQTLMAPASVVGDRTSWTMDELLEIYSTLPDGSPVLDISGFYFSGQETLLRLLCQERYIDWEGGACRFDSEDFISLLELCSRVRDPSDGSGANMEDGGAALREGRQLLTAANLSPQPGAALFNGIIEGEARCGGPSALTDYEGEVVQKYGLHSWNYTGIDGTFEEMKQAERTDGTPLLAEECAIGALEGGGYATYPGYPTESGSGGYFYFVENVSLSAACKDKAGAWEFLRQRLLPGGCIGSSAASDGTASVTMPGYPLNRSDFETMAAQAMEPQWCVKRESHDAEIAGPLLDENGEPVEAPVSAVQVGLYEVYMLVPVMASANRQHYERFMDLYYSIDRFDVQDDMVSGIVEELTGPYFAGDKSAGETAKLIQGRVQLYLDEQK